jgi:phosphoribosylanthranilate isomerase
MKIKICGLSREEDIAYVNEAKPDLIGFVFAKSRRQVSDKQAKKLKSLLDTHIKSVGVFIDEPREHIVNLVKEGIIDIIQLHGHESQDDIEYYKKTCHVPIIKARHVDDSKHYDCDFDLIDNINPGSGQKFDWSLIKVNKPTFLAGGIGIDDIEELSHLPIVGIDLSSSVETDGIKDREKIIDIVRRVRCK